MVQNNSHSPLGGISVQACLGDTTTCQSTTTGQYGNFSFTGLTSGVYQVNAQDPLLLPGHAGNINVAAGATVNVNLVLLPDSIPLPPGVSVVIPGAKATQPFLIHWNQPNPFTISGLCPGGTNTMFTIVQNGMTVVSGPLREDPVGSGTYTGVIPKLEPNNHGYAVETVTVQCPGGTFESVSFVIYIDPSGTVESPGGQPIADATVTLLYAASASGPFQPVPNGSDIMSPANRTNPMVTTANGRFGWDVVPGFYEVQATKSGCYVPASPLAAVASTQVLQIPPAATGLVLTLDCSGSPVPVITSAGNATFTAGTSGTFTLTASGAPIPALSETGSLPSGVTFTPNSNGTATLAVSSTASAGVTTFTVNAANGVGAGTSQVFTLTINPASGPAITSAASANFTAGTAGTFTVTSTGSPTPALSETGTLPSGVTFTNNGNGTATLTIGSGASAGTTNFTITASNGVSPNASQAFTLDIN